MRYPLRYYRVRARQMIYDIANGIHSGLPICCVLSYSVLGRHGGYWGERPRQYGPGHPQYVQCCRCYHNNHVVVIKDNGMTASWFAPPPYRGTDWHCNQGD